MAISVKTTGSDTLTKGPSGFSGTMTVTISGGGASKEFNLNVPVQDAPSRDAAVDRALAAADMFAKELHAQVSRERAHNASTDAPPLKGNL